MLRGLLCGLVLKPYETLVRLADLSRFVQWIQRWGTHFGLGVFGIETRSSDCE